MTRQQDSGSSNDQEDKRKKRKGSGKGRRTIAEAAADISIPVFPEPILEDGFDNIWVDRCDRCDKYGVLEVVRPGKVQCRICGH